MKEIIGNFMPNHFPFFERMCEDVRTDWAAIVMDDVQNFLLRLNYLNVHAISFTSLVKIAIKRT
jgi:hypothetical protein